MQLATCQDAATSGDLAQETYTPGDAGVQKPVLLAGDPEVQAVQAGRLHRADLLRDLRGELDRVPFNPDPIFGLQVPVNCPGVPKQLLSPRATWPDPAEFDSRARHLAALFQQNFASFSDQASEAVRQAGPRG